MSKLFENYVMQKCEQFLSEDEAYQKFNQEILRIENNLKKTFSENQIELFNFYEEKNINLQDYTNTFLYKKGYFENLK